MQDWCNYVRKLRMELIAQDPDSAVSDKSLASKMLRGSGLTRKERAQVLFNCGGTLDSGRVETVLKVTYSDMQLAERKTGQVVSHKRYERREESRGRDTKPKHYSKCKPHRKPWTPNRVHEADIIEEEAAESQSDEQS